MLHNHQTMLNRAESIAKKTIAFFNQTVILFTFLSNVSWFGCQKYIIRSNTTPISKLIKRKIKKTNKKKTSYSFKPRQCHILKKINTQEKKRKYIYTL
jgi:hypothetical protein